METPGEPTRTSELVELLTDQLAEAVHASSNRRELIRLTRMQGHVAELQGLLLPAEQATLAT